MKIKTGLLSLTIAVITLLVASSASAAMTVAVTSNPEQITGLSEVEFSFEITNTGNINNAPLDQVRIEGDGDFTINYCPDTISGSFGPWDLIAFGSTYCLYQTATGGLTLDGTETLSGILATPLREGNDLTFSIGGHVSGDGPEAAIPTNTIAADANAPTAPAITLPADEWQSGDFNVDITWSDNVELGTCSYQFGNSEVQSFDCSGNLDYSDTYSISTATDCTVEGSDACTIRAWAVDGVGNTGEEASDSASIDFENPVAYDPIVPIGLQTENGFDVDLQFSDSNGLSSCSYTVNGVEHSFECSGTDYSTTNHITVGIGQDCEAEGFGVCQIYATATDVAGKLSDSSNIVTADIDYNAPTTLIDPLADTWQSGDFPVTITWTDVVGLQSCYYQLGSSEPVLVDCLGQIAANANPTVDTTVDCNIEGEGTCVINAWAIDSVGHISTETPLIANIDLNDPTAEVTNVPEGWQSGDFQVTLNFADTDALASCAYYVNGVETPVACSGTSFSTPATITVGDGMDCSAEGINSCEIYAEVTDVAGKSVVTETSSISVDYQDPTVEMIEPVPRGWQNGDFQVFYSLGDSNALDTCTVTINGALREVACGDASTVIKVGEGLECSAQGIGACEVYFTATDISGKSSSSEPTYFDVDYYAVEEPLAVLSNPGEDNYINQQEYMDAGYRVMLGLTCTDSISGIPADSEISGNDNGEGIRVYYSANGADWDDIADGNVDYDCDQGFVKIKYSALGDGEFYFFAIASDRAENTEDFGSQEGEVVNLGMITIDTTAPAIDSVTTPGLPLIERDGMSTYWTNEPLTVSASTSDDFGVASCNTLFYDNDGNEFDLGAFDFEGGSSDYALSNEALEGAGELWVSCTDNAGNENRMTYDPNAYLGIDRTSARVISVSPTGTYYGTGNVEFTAKLCDSLTYPNEAYLNIPKDMNELIWMQPVNDPYAENEEFCRDFLTQIDVPVEAIATSSVIHNDLAGNQDAYDWIIEFKSTFNLQLYGGLNLKSLPIIPNDKNVATVFGEASEDISGVWTYNANEDKWYGFNPQTGLCSENCLSTVEDGIGYYINADAQTSTIIYGSEFQGEQTLPSSYPIVKGAWNLIGVKSKQWVLADDYLSGLDMWKYPTTYFNNDNLKMFCARRYCEIEGDSDENPADGLCDLSGEPPVNYLFPGESYWIYIPDGNEITPPITNAICPGEG